MARRPNAPSRAWYSGETLERDVQGDDMRGIATSLGQRPTLAPYQNRSCVRCGEHTIFVLDDPAGGWYACIKCGRFAEDDRAG